MNNDPSVTGIKLLVSVPTIYKRYKLWREQGIEGSANKQKTGRKPKATDEYCIKLEIFLAKDPSEFGYRFAIWTLDRLRIYLEKETGILLSVSRFLPVDCKILSRSGDDLARQVDL
jgi:transposase